MQRGQFRRCAFATVVAGALVAYACPAARAGADHVPLQGPSSTSGPYVVPLQSTWTATALITAGDGVRHGEDVVRAYRMVGAPGGLAALNNGDGTATILINHKLKASEGSVRAHGAKGSFLSQWTIDRNSLRVLYGRDLASQVITNGKPALSQLGSVNLPGFGAFFNESTGYGYDGHIVLSGEDSGAEDRQFAWVLEERAAYELPRFGRFRHANAHASPYAGDTTVVISNADMQPASSDGQANGRVFVYVGQKRATGNPVERAGLANGKLYGLVVDAPFITPGLPFSGNTENRADDKGTSGTFTLAELDPESPAAELEAAARVAQVTSFLRPGDGVWDLRNPARYFFTTMDRLDSTEIEGGFQVGRSRLWSLTFTDLSDPTKGGRIDMLLDGREGGNMFENLSVDRSGRIYLQENTGNAAHASKIWTYDPVGGTLAAVMRSDPARFGDIVAGKPLPAKAPFTQDESTSGILDVTGLFADAVWFHGGQVFLATVQARYRTGDQEIVEGGQLVLLYRHDP
jgi:serralysin